MKLPMQLLFVIMDVQIMPVGPTEVTWLLFLLNQILDSTIPNIHSPNDTFSVSGTATHATKFAKLCAEFLIEVAKSEGSLSVGDHVPNASLLVSARQGVLLYDVVGSAQEFTSVQLYDIQGKLVVQEDITSNKGQISLPELSKGMYVVSLSTQNEKSISQKVLLK